MASMVNKSTVEQLLLPRFCELCGDGKLFQVRKVSAYYLRLICASTLEFICSNLEVKLSSSISTNKTQCVSLISLCVCH